jgi:hypothetical protein
MLLSYPLKINKVYVKVQDLLKIFSRSFETSRMPCGAAS